MKSSGGSGSAPRAAGTSPCRPRRLARRRARGRGRRRRGRRAAAARRASRAAPSAPRRGRSAPRARGSAQRTSSGARRSRREARSQRGSSAAYAFASAVARPAARKPTARAPRSSVRRADQPARPSDVLDLDEPAVLAVARRARAPGRRGSMTSGTPVAIDSSTALRPALLPRRRRGRRRARRTPARPRATPARRCACGDAEPFEPGSDVAAGGPGEQDVELGHSLASRSTAARSTSGPLTSFGSRPSPHPTPSFWNEPDDERGGRQPSAARAPRARRRRPRAGSLDVDPDRDPVHPLAGDARSRGRAPRSRRSSPGRGRCRRVGAAGSRSRRRTRACRESRAGRGSTRRRAGSRASRTRRGGA